MDSGGCWWVCVYGCRVCVDLVLVVVVASVVRFLQFFLLQVVMPVAAVVAFVIVVVSVLVAVAPSAAHCCGLLRSLPHLLRLFLFSGSGSGLVAFRPCRCLLPRGSRCGRVSLLPFITDGRRIRAVVCTRFIFVRLQNERRDLALDQIAPFRRMEESIRPRPFHRPEARGRLRRLKFSLGLWPEWAWPVRPGIACDIC